MRVDEVEFGRLLPRIPLARAENNDRVGRIRPLVPNQYRRFAASNGFDLAGPADGGHFKIAGLEDRIASHIARRAVGESGDHEHLLLAARPIKNRVFRQNLQLCRASRFAELAAFRDPLMHDLVGP